MSNIFKNLDYKNKTTRSSFDLSSRVAFTAKPGQILPVKAIPIIPGDHLSIRLKHFTRTQPVNTPAFTRMQEYFDFYLVPMQLMWKSFKSSVTQMESEPVQATSLTGDLKVGSQMPYFTTASLYANNSKSILGMFRDNFNESLAGRDQFGFYSGNKTLKLLNYLRYGYVSEKYLNPDEIPTTPLYNENYQLSPFPLLAYQKVYFDYFRNSQWEENSAFCYNVDYNNGEELDLSQLDIDSIGNSMFTLRYCNYPKDLIFGIQPNSQYGDEATVNFDSDVNVNLPSQQVGVSVNGDVVDSNNESLGYQVDPSASVNQAYVVKSGGGSFSSYEGKMKVDASGTVPIPSRQAVASFNSAFSILALRQAEALQRWKEVAQSGDRNYRDQIYKHFGVTLPQNESGMSIYLGGSSSPLNINEVVSQNIDFEKGNLANLAGKGVGAADDTVTVDSKDYAILLCVYHCVPLVDYDTNGYAPITLQTDASDYAIPEFDHIGMETLNSNVFSMNLSFTTADGVMGYVPRYISYKTDIDYILGDFKNTLKHWVAPISSDFINEYTALGVNKNFFKVNPRIVDPIFAVAANDNESTDCLLINANFQITAVRNLDYNGMPY